MGGRRGADTPKKERPVLELPTSRVTLPFDRVFAGVGRIRVRSGTANKATFKRLNRLLTWLYQKGGTGHIWLRRIQAGAVAPLDVLQAATQGKLKHFNAQLKQQSDSLPDEWRDWAEKRSKSRSSKFERLGALTALSRALGSTPLTRSTLVDALLAYAGEAEETPAMFNRVRSAALAFLRDKHTRRHRLYKDVHAIDSMEERKNARPGPTIAQAIQIRDALEPIDGAIWWGMFVTGMGPSEYDGEWSIEQDHVHIEGTKRETRIRDVPLIWPEMERQHRHPRTFGDKIRALAISRGWDLEPYDARRGYKQLLEDAKLPGTLVETYHGHSIRGTIGPRYSVRDLEIRFEEGGDAALLRALIEQAEATVRAGKAKPPRALKKKAAAGARGAEAIEEQAGGAGGKLKSPPKSPRKGKSTGTQKAGTS